MSALAAGMWGGSVVCTFNHLCHEVTKNTKTHEANLMAHCSAPRE
jgi:hypothetical protein